MRVTSLAGIRGGACLDVAATKDVVKVLGHLQGKGVRGIKDSTDKCLLNSIAAILYDEKIKKKHGLNYREAVKKGKTYWPYHRFIKHENINFPADQNDIYDLARQNPGMRITVFFQFGQDFYAGLKSPVTGDYPENEIKNVNLVFLQYRSPKTGELVCHFAPITSASLFCATRYLKKDYKGRNIYSFYDKIVVCPHCELKFPQDSVNFVAHVDNCLSDQPTEYKLPSENCVFEFNAHKKVLGQHYSIYADFECLCQGKNFLCDFCSAKLEAVIDRDKIQKIKKSCSHKKQDHKKCPHCFIKIGGLAKSMENKCLNKGHQQTSEDDLKLCEQCRNEFNTRKDSVIHTSTHVEACQVCLTKHDYCDHLASQSVASLEPCLYTLVVIDNLYGKLRNEFSYNGEDPVGHFFRLLDDLYIELETEYFERCQNFPQLTLSMMNLDERYDFKNANEICFKCNKFTPRSSRVIDHCHISGEIRGMACSR